MIVAVGVNAFQRRAKLYSERWVAVFFNTGMEGMGSFLIVGSRQCLILGAPLKKIHQIWREWPEERKVIAVAKTKEKAQRPNRSLIRRFAMGD